MKYLNIAHAGAGHTHYAHFLEYTQQYPYCKTAGVYDDDPEKAKRWAAVVGTKCYGSYQEILDDPTVDGVVITCNPMLHEEYIIRAAKAGKHCYAEQPLAISVEAANNIRDAVKEAGIHFALANPVKKAPYVFAKNLADSGALGDILQIRVRTLHNNSIKYVNGVFDDFGYVFDKKLSGGGAMNNMGCHGVKILRWFLGRPVSVCGMFSSYTDIAKANDIEENAIVVYKFANGAIGSIETGWVHPGFTGALEVHGTNGSVIVNRDGISYRLVDNDKGWVKVIDKLLPAGVPTTLPYWINNIMYDLPDEEYGIDEAVELTEMICKGYESQGKEILFD